MAALGFGAMVCIYNALTELEFKNVLQGLSAFYGNRVSDEESHEVIKTAVEEGCTFIDTSNVRKIFPIT